MQKKEWLISLCILCVLALAAAGITAFVIRQNTPEKVAAFENRFLDLRELDITTQDTMEIDVSQQQLTLTWPAGEQKLMASTAVKTLPEGCAEWQVTLGGGGNQNGFQKWRNGYQVWLRLCMIGNGEILTETWTEMPLLADRADRTRIYTASASAEGADSWRLDVVVNPLWDGLAEGMVTLKNWEVHAR